MVIIHTKRCLPRLYHLYSSAAEPQNYSTAVRVDPTQYKARDLGLALVALPASLWVTHCCPSYIIALIEIQTSRRVWRKSRLVA